MTGFAMAAVAIKATLKAIIVVRMFRLELIT
jgi:hypothetical protein